MYQKIYAEDVKVVFNTVDKVWELRLLETDEVIDTASTVVGLINNNNCLC